MYKRKSQQLILILIVFFMMLFPIIVTFNDALTRIIMRLSLYSLLQEFAVPVEIKIVGFVVRLFGISYTPLSTGMIVNNNEMYMEWNCLGWQSLLLFFVSLIVGLWGNRFTLSSKLQTIFLGIFGIFWINILRISFTVILYIYALPVYQFVFHDFLAAFVTIFYLLWFWWFAYRYILEEKNHQ